ncbi:RedB protein [Corallococcus carmarthensis]|uniref:RedB protein n=1 Tax=Corallococcus carmarthensis TaxID=2316728 RepID=UPI00148CD43F|nr:RedB protein [Corallococcus carmarthensis]NOK20675.1 RedB protein [Corallococcus carmarthensis]
MNGPSTRAWLVLAGALWLGGIGTGVAALARYSMTPGVAPLTAATWPEGTRLTRQAGRPVLVMLAHPKCTCTRASLAELAELMEHGGGRAKAFVLFLRPEGLEDGWEQGDLWRTAASIPGVTVLSDPDGLEAKRFGATTSGHVVLYDADGRLRFSGGITVARGHVGDSPGREALERVLREDGEGGGTPVYGCALEAPREG